MSVHTSLPHRDLLDHMIRGAGQFAIGYIVVRVGFWAVEIGYRMAGVEGENLWAFTMATLAMLVVLAAATWLVTRVLNRRFAIESNPAPSATADRPHNLAGPPSSRESGQRSG